MPEKLLLIISSAAWNLIRHAFESPFERECCTNTLGQLTQLANLFVLVIPICYIAFYNGRTHYFLYMHFYSFNQFLTTRKELLSIVVNIFGYKKLYFIEPGYIFVLICWLIHIHMDRKKLKNLQVLTKISTNQ